MSVWSPENPAAALIIGGYENLMSFILWNHPMVGYSLRLSHHPSRWYPSVTPRVSDRHLERALCVFLKEPSCLYELPEKAAETQRVTYVHPYSLANRISAGRYVHNLLPRLASVFLQGATRHTLG